MRATGSILAAARVAARPSNTVLDTHLAKRRHRDYRNLALARNPLKMTMAANFTVYNTQRWVASVARTDTDTRLQRDVAHLASHGSRYGLGSTHRHGSAPWNDWMRRRASFHVAAAGRRDARRKKRIYVAASPEALAVDDPLDAILDDLIAVGRRWDAEDGFLADATGDAQTVHSSQGTRQRHRTSPSSSPPAATTPVGVALVRGGPASVLGFVWERDAQGTEELRAAMSLPSTLTSVVSSTPRWRWCVRESREDTGFVIHKLRRLRAVEVLGFTTETFWKCLCALASTDGVSVTPGLANAVLTAVSEHYHSLSPSLRQLECLRMLRSILSAEMHHRSSSSSDGHPLAARVEFDLNHHDGGNAAAAAAGAGASPWWVTASSLRAADQVAAVCPRLTTVAWRALPPLFHYLLRRRRSPLDAVDALFHCLTLCAGRGRRHRLPHADLCALLPMRCRNGAALYLFLRHVLRLQPLCGDSTQALTAANGDHPGTMAVGARVAGYHETSFADLVAELRVSAGAAFSLSSASSTISGRNDEGRLWALRCAIAVVTDAVAESVLMATQGIVHVTHRAETPPHTTPGLAAGVSLSVSISMTAVMPANAGNEEEERDDDGAAPPTVTRSALRAVESMEWATCWFEALARGGLQPSAFDERFWIRTEGCVGGGGGATTRSSSLHLLCGELRRLVVQSIAPPPSDAPLSSLPTPRAARSSHSTVNGLLRSRAEALHRAVRTVQSMVSSPQRHLSPTLASTTGFGTKLSTASQNGRAGDGDDNDGKARAEGQPATQSAFADVSNKIRCAVETPKQTCSDFTDTF